MNLDSLNFEQKWIASIRSRSKTFSPLVNASGSLFCCYLKLLQKSQGGDNISGTKLFKEFYVSEKKSCQSETNICDLSFCFGDILSTDLCNFSKKRERPLLKWKKVNSIFWKFKEVFSSFKKLSNSYSHL